MEVHAYESTFIRVTLTLKELNGIIHGETHIEEVSFGIPHVVVQIYRKESPEEEK